MYYTDDPIRDFARRDAAEARYESKLPTCAHCGEPIFDEYLYVIDGEPYCEECLNYNFRKRVEDFED